MVQEEAQRVEREMGEQGVDVHRLGDNGGTKTVNMGGEERGRGGEGSGRGGEGRGKGQREGRVKGKVSVGEEDGIRGKGRE